MRVQPGWRIALGVFVAYNLLIFLIWKLLGVDYEKLVAEAVAFRSLVLPLAIGSVFIAGAVTVLGWWRPVMTERTRRAPGWALWAVAAALALLFSLQAWTTNWSELSFRHVGLLAAAGILVGFNEELAARGVLVVGVRGSTRNETWVWLASLLLFGAMHVANALVGLAWYAGLIQGVFAFLTGTGFYVLRRASGTLLVPMAAHALWDFFAFTTQATDADPRVPLLLLPVVFLVSLAAVVAILRRDKGRGGADDLAPRHDRSQGEFP